MTVLDSGEFPADWLPPAAAITADQADQLDDYFAPLIPHAVRLAVAVRFADRDAAAVATQHAYEAAGGWWMGVVLVLADLVGSAEGAKIRAEVRSHRTVGETLDALTAAGMLPP